MTIRSITTLLFVTLLCAAAATPATAQVTRYVATTGDDQQGDNDCTDPGNPCATIQQAVDQASFQVADVIEVAAGTYNEFDIVVDDKTLTIQGASAATTIIDAQNNGRILEVAGISDVTLNDITLRNGEGFDGGAAYVTGGLTVNRCVFENNTAPVSEGDSNGGAIFGSFATLSITESTFDANTASGDGGALFARSSIVTIASSLFVGNDADNGGGVALVQDSDGGSATLTNNTFYNNSASIDGGGLYYREFSDRSITVSSSTVVGNSASDGGGIYFDDVEASQGSLEYGNSLFADNAPNNIAQTGFSSSVLLSLGHNLLDDASGDPTPEPTDQRNTSPRLESLADNGGPTQTIRPLTSSPALDAGSCSVVSDQRGDPRPYDNPDLPNAPGGNGCDIGAVELQASEFASTTRYVATTGSDTNNDCTDPGAPCATLDHAVTVSGPGDTIDVASGTYTEAGITLNKSLTITGAGATATTVQAAAQPGSASDRLFFIVSGVTVSLSDLTMSNGVAFGEDGGGILVESSASLTVQRSILRGHRAFDAEGGGLGGAIYSAGTLVLEDTFFEDNQAPDDAGGAVFGTGPVTVTTSTFTANSAIDGGALFLLSASPQSIETSTFSQNTASGEGGGVFFEGFGDGLSVTSSTFSDNAASGSGGAIHFERVEGGVVTYGNTIFTQNSPQNLGLTDNISGPDPYQSLGFNLLSDDSGDPTPPASDQLNTVADLEPVADNGGLTPTALPSSSSPALDAGQCLDAVDQRGEPRTVDLPLIPNASVGCDVGAVELQSAEFDPLTRYVASDGDDADGENDCSIQGDPCATIANALSYAQDGETVRVFGGTYTEAGLFIDNSVQILGDGPGVTIVQAAPEPGTALNRVFEVGSGNTVEVRALTVQHGVAVEGSGGGILSPGQLTVDDVAFRANQADGSGGAIDAPSADLDITNSLFEGNSALGVMGRGGAIRAEGGVIEASTFAQNSANEGGGVAFDGDGEDNLFILNSTFSENSASTRGGGIFYQAQGFSFLRVASSTFFFNDAPDAASIGFAGNSQDGNVDYVNSIFAAEGANFDDPISPAFVSLGANIFTDDPGTTFSGDQVNTDPLLLPLADNGGATRTHLPLGSSPAIDQGTCTDAPTVDQRGETRPYDDPGTPNFNEGCDVGAVEVQMDGFLGGPELALAKNDGGITVQPGDVIVYQITASNAGDVPATGIVLTETLPANTTFVPGQSADWVDEGEGTFTLALDPISPQDDTVVDFAVQVDVAPPLDADPISNTVEGAGDFGTTATATDTTPLQLGADLELEKVVDNEAPAPGEVVTFTLTLFNQGPLEATGVVVTDQLPDALTFVGASPSSDYDPQTGEWAVGVLPAASSVTLEIEAEGDVPATFTNRAEVTQSSPFDPDSTPGNDSTTEDDDAEASVTIIAPAIAVTPDILRFGQVAVGATVSAPVVVTNTGTATLQVGGSSITGPDQTSFRLGAGKALPPVPPGEQYEIPVTFAPTEGGNKVATLVIDTELGTYTVGLRGTGLGPALAVAPASVDFGTVTPDSLVERTVTISNDGTSPLTVASLQVAGADAALFAAPNADSVGEIAPGSTADVILQFQASEGGRKTATLQIDSDGGAATVALQANVLTKSIAVSPAALDFDVVDVGSSAQASLTVRNDGQAPVSIDGFSVSGAHAADFTATGPTGPLAPGATIPVAATFTPSEEGTRTATLAIAVDQEVVEVGLSGEGNAPDPVVSAAVTPEAIDFGEVPLGESASGAISVENTGTALLTIGGAGIEGPDAAAFALGEVPEDVPVGASATIAVTFTADAPGAQTAEAVVETAAGTFRVGLQAQVPAPPSLTVTPTRLDFGDVFVGGTAEQTVQLSNPGGTAVTLSSVAVAGSEAFSLTGAPGEIAPGGSETATVRFAPTASGAQSATLQVESPSVESASVALNGTGTRPELSVSVTPDPAQAGQPVTVSVTAPPGFTPGQGQLFYRPGGASSFTSAPLSAQGNGFGASVPGSAVSERGVDYYLELVDGPVTGTFPTEQADEVPAHLRVRLEELPTQRSLAAQRYAIVAPSLVPDAPGLDAVFGDDYGLPYDRADWRVLRWNPQQEDYDEFPDLPGFEPGRAFWLVTSSGAPYDVGPGLSIDASVPPTAAARSTGTASAQQVTLAPGWNMIGGLFPFDVAWADVEAPSSVRAPQAWDAASESFVANQTVLERERGYFVLNTASQPATLTVPPIAAPQASKTEPTPPWAAAEYALQLVARMPAHGLLDRSNVVGLAAGAQEGWDALDAGEPPPVGDHVRLSIVTSAAASPSERLAASLKPMTGEGQQWDLELSAALPSAPYALRKEVTLQLVEHGRRPQDFQVYVLDLDRGVPLLTNAPAGNETVTLTLSGERPLARLRVLIGTEQFAEARNDGISLEATETLLEPAYPNPFNPETVIGYRLREPADVVLEIYDALGRRVRQLVAGEQAAGRHEVVWDARDDRGRTVASGIYFCRMQAGEYVATRTLTLVR